MKNIFFISIQFCGMFLLYGALCVIFVWLFDYHLPLSTKLDKSVFFAGSVFIILPIIGFLSVKFGGRNVYLVLGYIYIVAWIIIIFRLLNILLSK